jgi:hypothetical protein
MTAQVPIRPVIPATHAGDRKAARNLREQPKG